MCREYVQSGCTDRIYGWRKMSEKIRIDRALPFWAGSGFEA